MDWIRMLRDERVSIDILYPSKSLLLNQERNDFSHLEDLESFLYEMKEVEADGDVCRRKEEKPWPM